MFWTELCREAVGCVLDRVVSRGSGLCSGQSCVARQWAVFWTQYRVVGEWAVLLLATVFLVM